MMSRLQKILLGIGIAVLAAIVIAVQWVASPGQYQTALQAYIADATGYELVIAGDTELDLLPMARLTFEDVRLRNPGLPQELASASLIQLELDRGDLLRGELTIRELLVDGFHVNVYIDAAGNSIWDAGNLEAPAEIGGGIRCCHDVARADCGSRRPGGCAESLHRQALYSQEPATGRQ